MFELSVFLMPRPLPSWGLVTNPVCCIVLPCVHTLRIPSPCSHPAFGGESTDALISAHLETGSLGSSGAAWRLRRSSISWWRLRWPGLQ